MMTWAVVLLLAAFAAVPAVMFLRNWPQFKLDEADFKSLDNVMAPWAVSVLIPARDESDGIESSIRAALQSRHVDVEVVILDDHSTDGTGAIVQKLGESDSRVVYEAGNELPEGWNGKQFACAQLADVASHDRMVFLDADVRLEPDALAILARRQDRTEVALLSAFPHQLTDTFWEKLIIPLMHFVLLGFLPFNRMRSSTHPAYAAGCGQLFMTRRGDYRTAGTHAVLAGSRHDGVKLPKAYRESGLSTDVVDGTNLAQCRMYGSATEVFRGVLKNATEGIANPRVIIPFTLMMVGGTLAPLVTLGLLGGDIAILTAMVLVLIIFLPRALAASKMRQSWLGVAFHPIAILVFIVLQWIALLYELTGQQVAWRGRAV